MLALLLVGALFSRKCVRRRNRNTSHADFGPRRSIHICEFMRRKIHFLDNLFFTVESKIQQSKKERRRVLGSERIK